MAHTQPDAFDTVSPDAKIALTEYRTDMIAALEGMEMPEAAKLGEQLMSASLEDKWPVSSGDLVYSEIVGDHPNLVEFGEHFFNLTTKEYGTGVIEKAARLRSSEWAAFGWGRAPAKNAEGLMFLFEELIAAILENGSTTNSWTNKGSATKKVFDTSKPCDPVNPNNGHLYTNLHTSTALSVANIAAMRTSFRTQKNTAGRPRGYKLTHIVCGPDLEDELLTYLNDPVIAVVHGSSTTETATMETNLVATHYPGIKPVILSTLDDANVWYPIAADGGLLPWLTLMKLFAFKGAAGGMPTPGIQAADGLEWISLDETSDHYKVGSKLGPAGTLAQWSKARLGAAITAEWRIKRCAA